MPRTSVIGGNEVILLIGGSKIKNEFVFGKIEWIVEVHPWLYNISLEENKISKYVSGASWYRKQLYFLAS